MYFLFFFFFFSSRRRHTRCSRDWSSDVCSSDLAAVFGDSLRTHHLSQWLYAKTFGHPYFLAFVSRQLLALAHGSLVDRKSTRLNSSHGYISYAVFCLKKKSRTQSGPTNRMCLASQRRVNYHDHDLQTA